MVSGYSDERAVQMLIYILKENHIKKVIASPGATNLTLVGSLEYDGSFELYSCPDERSAAYMACGLSMESGEPVVLTCTGATASRDYLPGLSEAFYRKLPILAVTSTQSLVNAENLSPQFLDRTSCPKDSIRYSVQIQHVRGATDEWDCMLKINRAIQELFRDGGGPVHINLTTVYSENFCIKELPETQTIQRYTRKDKLPAIAEDKSQIAISVGVHRPWNQNLERAVERFCEKYGAVVLVDHASGYSGKFRIHPTLLTAQGDRDDALLSVDLLLHIGEQSADYYTYSNLMKCKEVWRISEDGQIRDTFHHLTKIFDMPEIEFFESYLCEESLSENQNPLVRTENLYYRKLKAELDALYFRIPELPFSNVWAASVMAEKVPGHSIVHLGLSNSMRAWTFFDFRNPGIRVNANVGCRGIDGVLSTLLGASLVHPDVLYFCVLGDLAFFYDMNVLGNRHAKSNLRILLVNNDGGSEFHLHQHMGFRVIGEDRVGAHIAADGHNGRKSKALVKHYAQDLGYAYMSAENKEEFLPLLERFLDPVPSDKPMILEMFTKHEDEREAVRRMTNLSRNSPWST